MFAGRSGPRNHWEGCRRCRGPAGSSSALDPGAGRGSGVGLVRGPRRRGIGEQVLVAARVQAGVAGEDADALQLLVVASLALLAVQAHGRGTADRSGLTRWYLLLPGPPDQVGDLVSPVGHAFADTAAGAAVDKDEEGRTRHLVVTPRLGRDLELGSLGHRHHTEIGGKS